MTLAYRMLTRRHWIGENSRVKVNQGANGCPDMGFPLRAALVIRTFALCIEGGTRGGILETSKMYHR